MTENEGPGDAQPKGEHEDRPELDIDTAFAAIIADFSAPTPTGANPWPASEDLDDDTEPEPDAADAETDPPLLGRAPDGDGPPRAEDTPSGPPSGRWDLPVRRITIPEDAAPLPDADDDEDEEGFVPPEPPPLPRGDLVSRVAWAAVIGGPLFLLVAAMAWRGLPAYLLLFALLAFVGGFVTLVARMPQEHPDDPDDGAVV
jgi:hypothetical protein